MKKYRIVTLGCRTNQYESQLFADQLREKGYVPAVGEEADLCIINTCSVTDAADSSSRAEIRKMARSHPHARLVVTGCMAQGGPEALRAIDGRIEFLQDKARLISFLFPDESDGRASIERFDGHTRAFVKVQDGCNSFCSYCAVPYVRGRSRSRALAGILQEVRVLVNNGYQEIVLTGINIGDYHADGALLADLVRAVDCVEGVRRLRLSSIDPNDVDESLIQTFSEGQHVCPSMHLVLQSGSDAVLKRMNRKYDRQKFMYTVEQLKRTHADFAFTTDVIVGFPGESDCDFCDTLNIVRQVQFAKVHVFPYSVRSRTRAALYPDRVPRVVQQERKEALLREAHTSAHALRERFCHRTMEVLLEEGDGDWLSGHTTNFLPVRVVRGRKEINAPVISLRSLRAGHQANEFVQVELFQNCDTYLMGRVV